MSYRQAVLMHVLDRFQGERSVNAVYHLLKGKRSSQTIQDAGLFALSPFFGCLSTTLTRDTFLNDIEWLWSEGYVISTGKHKAVLTEKGRDLFLQFNKSYPAPQRLNGAKYHSRTDEFWRRLYHLLDRDAEEKASSSFMLAEKSTLLWLDQFCRSHSKGVWVRAAYDELLTLLNQVDQLSACMFVYKLSRPTRTGWTLEQAGKRFGIGIEGAELYWRAALHHLFGTVMNAPQRYQNLSLLLEGTANNPLTQSAAKTLPYAERGASISDIALKRRLKESTIEDHIIEIASHLPHFQWKDYILSEHVTLILPIIREGEGYSLKRMKEKLPPEVSYFSIRLCLAREKGAFFQDDT
ncbi:hypothetical protein G4V62_01370 [Bacillaceae bacterium SIJ1]|uniref:helix-turn-helix domain-containing protein n=1 Tax=Litoribacterium kuwaitense TaxID=1398745 RepID=UPI0013EA43DE|nr:helix-turn-helix domain-containing protein [Litoribacterium kuwaitense]NGP43676.1 hypothetical protein [Litoribacterium kuwaitense]